MSQAGEPSPAVPRAVAIIALLDTVGPLRRDEIAARSGIPRSTTLRILTGLRQAGVVEGDRHDGFWRLRQRLVPVLDGGPDLLAAGRPELVALTAAGTHEVEVYVRDGDRLRLVHKAAASDAGVTTRVGPGWVHDCAQIDARSLLLAAWGHLRLRAPVVGSDGGRWDAERLQTETGRLRRRRHLHDGAFNPQGILRHAAALLAGRDLAGVLVLAQFLRPTATTADAALSRRVARAARSWSRRLSDLRLRS